MVSLEETLEDAQSVTLREHLVTIVGRSYDVLVDDEVVGQVTQKLHVTGTDEFRLSLEDGTYVARIVDTLSIADKMVRPGIKAAVYDADDDVTLRLDQNLVREKVRNPYSPAVWGTLRTPQGEVLATITKSGGDDLLLFDLYDGKNKEHLGSIHQREKWGRHTYAVSGPDKSSLVLVAALLDQLYHHTAGTKW